LPDATRVSFWRAGGEAAFDLLERTQRDVQIEEDGAVLLLWSTHQEPRPARALYLYENAKAARS
jgi:hypothetical protein